MPALFLNAGAAGAPGVQQRIYLDESGTLGYGGELFTMAMVLVHDLPKLEACTLKHRTTQSEVKASQMKTPQKLALAKTLLEENDIAVYLVKLDPLAAMACERKLDKDFLYDSMVAQALAHYLQTGALARDLPYRISMDMRGGLRESHEDVVGESVATVLMHRETPLVSGIDVRFLDSKYSAGVQAADLFSNIYRTSLTQTDSPCTNFLQKFEEAGRVHGGFAFGLPELADQMAQIANDLRARVEHERLVATQAAQAETPRAPIEAAAPEQAANPAAEETAAPEPPAKPPAEDKVPAAGERRSRRVRRASGSAARAAEAVVLEPAADAPFEAAFADAQQPAETDVPVDPEEPRTVVLPFAPQGMGTSRSARRRRARAARREREANETSEAAPAAVSADAPKPGDLPASAADPEAAEAVMPANGESAPSLPASEPQLETPGLDTKTLANDQTAASAEAALHADVRPGRAARTRNRRKAPAASTAQQTPAPIDPPAAPAGATDPDNPENAAQPAPAEKPAKPRRQAAKKTPKAVTPRNAAEEAAGGNAAPETAAPAPAEDANAPEPVEAAAPTGHDPAPADPATPAPSAPKADTADGAAVDAPKRRRGRSAKTAPASSAPTDAAAAPPEPATPEPVPAEAAPAPKKPAARKRTRKAAPSPSANEAPATDGGPAPEN